MLLVGAEEMRARAQSFAAWLLARGTLPGDRIALAPPTETDLLQAQHQQAAILAAVWGALSLGVIPVMVNPDLTEPERAYILADAQPNLTVQSTSILIRATSGRSTVELAPWPLGRPMHYTSGTTGRAKGVWSGVLSPADARGLWGDEVDMWQCRGDDRSLVHGPLSHSGPLRFAMYTLLAGGSVILPGRFDAHRHARAMEEFQPTIAFVVPSHMQRLLDVPDLPASTYRMLVHAGAACPPALKQAIHDWAGVEHVWEFYGSTEGQFTVMPGSQWAQRPGSVGQARSERELQIIDGVIWCRPPAYGVFTYWGDPVKTAAAWRRIDDQDWFTVGDVGWMDEQGFVFIEGRREDLIISGGMNVYPAEVESAICDFADVGDVAVFGVEDERWGQRVCAAITGQADLEDLAVFLNTRLAGYKRPKQLVRTTTLPRTASGKIQRLRVASMLGLQ